MKEFIFTYWKELACALGFIILTLVTLFKPKVKTIDTIKEIILAVLPSFITSVERPGDGSTKLKEVISLCLAYLGRLYPDMDFSKYISFIRESVENILKCPQRK